MKCVLREQWRSSALVALITIALGVVLVGWPDRSVSMICAILGGALLLSGLLYVIGWFAGKRRQSKSVFMIIPGVVLSGIGVWLMISSSTVISLIQYVFGAVVLFHGILDLQGTISLIAHRMRKWWVDLLLALITFGLGFLILANPFGTFSALVVLIGATLIYDGITDLWLIWRLSRAAKQALLPPETVVFETEGKEIDETEDQSETADLGEAESKEAQ